MIHVKTALTKMYEWVRLHSRGGDYKETLPYFDRLTELYEEREKYRWHDLKKHPEDLPNAEGHYLVYAPTYKGGSSKTKEVANGGYMFSRYKKGAWSIEVGYYPRPNCVRAWKEIEPVRK